MRKYDIYLIENEVAYHYFGREQVLYHFFEEAAEPAPHLIDTIERQFNYITRLVPIYVFDYHMKNMDALRKGYKLNKEEQKLTLYSRTSQAVLINSGRTLSLVSEGSYEAETLVFEHLRKLENSFLAISIEGKSIGWLSPIKQAHYI